MSNAYADLIEKIREKCRQQHWYGADMRSPAYIQKLNGHGSGFFWHDEQGNSYQINRDTDLSQHFIPQKFTYPPATDEQLRETERILGLPLNPCLREIYRQVANGGFGPSQGINGILGGYSNGGLGPMVERYVESRRYSRFVGPEVYTPEIGDGDYIEFPWYVEPYQLLEFCHWGCAMYSYLDNSTGRVYHYERSGIAGRCRYRCEAPALEVWLERWIAGTLTF